MKKEDFPISTDKIRELTAVCAKEAGAFTQSNDRAVYVNLSMVRLQLAWVMPKLIYARGVADRAGAKAYVICWRENEEFEKLARSLGFEFLCLEKLLHKDLLSALKAMFKTVSFMIFNGSGDGLKELRFCGVNAGKYLYEDILRTSSLSTIRSARNKTCLRKMFHLLWMSSALDRFLKKNRPLYEVADDLAYHEAIQLCLFRKHGAQIRNVSAKREEDIFFDKKGEPVRRGQWLGRCIREQLYEVEDAAVRAEELLEQNFAGISGRSIDRDAFRGKKILSREELTQRLDLDPGKKNAVIMAHTFTDAVLNYGDLYFRDYYDWVEKTLILAADTEDVNWILKPHPTRKAYNEESDSIEKLFERYKKPHMFILPDEVSAGSIKELADVLLTIGGNAGAEFSCFGIPAVIVGKPYYRGFGFTIEPDSLKAYTETLKHIKDIKPLDEEQIKTARKVYYYMKKGRRYNDPFEDDFANEISELYRTMVDKMGVDYFMSNKGTLEYNDGVCGYIIRYLQDHKISDTEYYSRGAMQSGDPGVKG